MHAAMPVRRRALATILSALLVAAGAVGVVAAPPASAATQDVAGATLDWGVKASFRSYVTGPIAGGTITPTGVAQDADGFTWSAGAGQADAAASTALASLPGSVRFEGHAGQLDVLLEDARVEVVSATEGYLVFDVTSKSFGSATPTAYPDTRVAQIDMTGLVVGEESISITGAASTLTAAGAPAFAGFYEPGTAMDPVSFTLPLVAVEEPTEPTNPEPTNPEPTDPGTDPTDPTDPTEPTEPTEPETPEAPAAPAVADPTHTVEAATFDWTFHAGWLGYQSAMRAITVSEGVVFNGPAAGFSYSAGTGSVDADAQQAVASFPGQIDFDAHGGMIDIELANARIEVVSATQGYVVFDATTVDGEFPNVRFATIDLANAVFGEDAITVTDAATAITAEGSAAFQSGYPAGTSFGTATFTLPLTAIEVPVDPTEPGTDPTEPTEPVETGLGVANATLQWGIKVSFRSYVVGPIANGAITPSGGVTMDASGFSWSNGTGVADEAAGTANVAYPGQIRFTGHGGQLDMTISDVRLRIDSATQATIVASSVSRSLETGSYVTQTGIDFATVALTPTTRLASTTAADQATAAIAEGTYTIANAPAVLTAQGAEGFAGFYEAGTGLDAVSATLPIAEVEAPREPGTPEVPQEPTPITPPIVTPTPTTPVAEVAPQAGEEQAQCTANAVSGATMTWGLRSSFRSYISGGIANGGWELAGGVTDADGGWQWSGGSGAIQLDERTGLVSLPGSIHFTGHSGALDLTISDVRIRMTGASTGTIVADVVSKGMEDGQLHTYADIAFASLSFSSTVSGGALTVEGATATLTAAGAEGFAGFYAAGEALDPVSFTLPIGGEVECSAATGTLPQTGMEQRIDVLLPMLALAVLLMAGGMLVRRRLASA